MRNEIRGMRNHLNQLNRRLAREQRQLANMRAG